MIMITKELFYASLACCGHATIASDFVITCLFSFFTERHTSILAKSYPGLLSL